MVLYQGYTRACSETVCSSTVLLIWLYSVNKSIYKTQRILSPTPKDTTGVFWRSRQDLASTLRR